jgi:hypothetical protein
MLGSDANSVTSNPGGTFSPASSSWGERASVERMFSLNFSPLFNVSSSTWFLSQPSGRKQHASKVKMTGKEADLRIGRVFVQLPQYHHKGQINLTVSYPFPTVFCHLIGIYF